MKTDPRFVFAGEVHGPPPCEEVHTRRSAVPRVTDHVLTAPTNTRNFVHWNALNQMRAPPPEKQEPKLVDQPNGNCQALDKSGLMPKYALKKVR